MWQGQQEPPAADPLCGRGGGVTVLRMRRLILSLTFVLCAAQAVAHLAGETLPEDADDIVVPATIPVLDAIRFTRMDHRLILYRIDRGDAHHFGALPVALTRAVARAGEINPRPTARILWEMSELGDPAARAAYLADKAEDLRQTKARMGGNAKTANIDIDTVDALLDLVILWQATPMAGFSNGAGE